MQTKFTLEERTRLLDVKDNNGDTVLNIAARLGIRRMTDKLIEAGANKYAANNVGLKPEDFVTDLKVRLLYAYIMNGNVDEANKHH
jgi:ankyrin repeat protein